MQRILLAAALLSAACTLEPTAELDRRDQAASGVVGLSLMVRDGQPAAPLNLEPDAPRYLQEIDLVFSATTADDAGIAPLMAGGAAAALDWRGVAQVEEDWRQEPDGTWTRQRFYLGARWMERSSSFRVVARDAAGADLDATLVAKAGKGDAWKQSDDGFVRRFVARQVARGCQARGDCSNVGSFVAEALVQLRHNLHPARRARHIPDETARLELLWTALPRQRFAIPVTHEPPAYAHGFRVELEEISAPASGSYYVPGEQVVFQVTLRDGAGNRLHPPGSLPSYAAFLRGEIESGLRYYDGFRLGPTLYYALKHREGMMALSLSGPTHRLRTPRSTLQVAELFAPQATVAATETDGFSAVAAFIPPGPILFGGTIDPAAWEAPLADRVTLTIPADAEPGTYVAAFKARRDYGGEALNRGATVEIQVGTAAPTAFSPATTCGGCHQGATGFGMVQHGLADRRACFSCHGALAFEPDNRLGQRVHTIHDRSDRFPGDVRECLTCHIEPPDGPALGLLE